MKIMSSLVGELLLRSAEVHADREALVSGGAAQAERVEYGPLALAVEQFAQALVAFGLPRGARVAVWAGKQTESVVAIFGAARAGCVFVPVNPLLKSDQAAYIVRDCNVRMLVADAPRLASFEPALATCPDLRATVRIGSAMSGAAGNVAHSTETGAGPGVARFDWDSLLALAIGTERLARVIDVDMAAILYTSGSTGQPKGVVLSHRNIVEGARSVSSYLENRADDRILAVLPLSFDYGLSQLTTSFLVGGAAVLHNYLLPQDVIRALVRERVTGLAAVPPLWLQLAALEWPTSIDGHLRYFTNSGGAMPTATLAGLRARVPSARPYLMYGLTEAFRSTYLPPGEVDRRPTSMGKAIPNAEILVVREDGSECAAGEPGELVHRGALVALGYWNDPEKTAERFRPLPGQTPELPIVETAVWSGDTVQRDEDGFLYFVSRRDEMIKTSGYRVSPTEVEEAVYASGLVAEVAAFGVEHPQLGQAIALVAQPAAGRSADTDTLVLACRARLPAYMLPQHVDWLTTALPRNANGKIDRKSLAHERAGLFAEGKEQGR